MKDTLWMTLILLIVAGFGAFSAPPESSSVEDEEAACLVLEQETRFIGAILRDPGGVRFEVVEALLDSGLCDQFQAVAFGGREARAVFPSWVRVADADVDQLLKSLRRRVLKEQAEEGDINLALWTAFQAFEEAEDASQKLVILLSDEALIGVNQAFKEIVPYLVRDGVRIYAFRFYFVDKGILYELTRATDGLVWPGSRAGIPAALECIADDLQREREQEQAELEQQTPLRKFLSSVIAEISVEIGAREAYWDDELVRLQTRLFYDDQPLGRAPLEVDLGGDGGRLRVDAVYVAVGGEEYPMRYGGGRWAAEFPLPAGSHVLEVLIEGRLSRGVEEEPFRVEAYTQVIVRERPQVALRLADGARGTYFYLRHQPIALELFVVKGRPADLGAPPKLWIQPPKGRSFYLTPTASEKGVFHTVFRPEQAGSYVLLVTGGLDYRAAPQASQLKLEVLPPRLEVPQRVVLREGRGCFPVRTQLFPPDVAVLAVEADDRLRPDRVRLELTPQQGEVQICLESVVRFPLISQLQRRGFEAWVRLLDVSGILDAPEGRYELTVNVVPPFPTWPVVGAILLLGLIVAIPTGAIVTRRRRQAQKGTFSDEDLVGREFRFPKPGGGGVLEIAVGRAPKGSHTIVIPREDVAETQFVITVQREVSKLTPKSPLKTYVNGAAALFETELSDGSTIEFGSGSGCSLRFHEGGQEVRLQVLRI